MRKKVQQCTFKPSDIDVTSLLVGTFGQTEREELATDLIRFAQHKGDWSDFRRSELREFLEYDIYLDEAEQNSLVEMNDDGTYSYMEHLINTAHMRHPKE